MGIPASRRSREKELEEQLMHMKTQKNKAIRLLISVFGKDNIAGTF